MPEQGTPQGIQLATQNLQDRAQIPLQAIQRQLIQITRKVTEGVEGAVLPHMDRLPSWALRGVFQYIERKGRPAIASINVVNECNLHCAGCYWQQTEAKQQRDELSLDESTALIDGLWKKGVRDFLFLGGEPLMRLDPAQKGDRLDPRDRTEHMVREVAKRGGISTVITNATYGIPAQDEWPRTHYFVSFDGDEHGMGRVRGKGVFEKAREAVQGRKDVVLAMTISNVNRSGIDQFVKNAKDWDVGGVVFSFASPQVGNRQSFYLNPEQKRDAVALLLQLKAEYGDFVVMSERTLELLGPDEVERWSPDCPTFFARSIRSDGVPIERCIFGPEGDCAQCGCNISAAAVGLREGDRETARMSSLPARLAGIL